MSKSQLVNKATLHKQIETSSKHIFITIEIECLYFVGVNLALDKSAFQSSNGAIPLRDFFAELAVDGNL